MRFSRRTRGLVLLAIVTVYALLVVWWRVTWPTHPDFVAYHRAGDIAMPVALLVLMAGGVAAYYALFPAVLAHRDRGAVLATLLLGLGLMAGRGLTAGVNDLFGERVDVRPGTITRHTAGAPRRGTPRDAVIITLDDGGELSFEVDRLSELLRRYPVGARVRVTYHRGPWFDWGGVTRR